MAEFGRFARIAARIRYLIDTSDNVVQFPVARVVRRPQDADRALVMGFVLDQPRFRQRRGLPGLFLVRSNAPGYADRIEGPVQAGGNVT